MAKTMKTVDPVACLALVVAVISCAYSVIQTGIAKKSYEASVSQLDVAKQAQMTAEANYKITFDQLELQKRVVAAES